MTTTITRRLTAIGFAVTAAGGLAIGVAGSAAAEPQETSRFTVVNDTKTTVQFLGYAAGTPAVKGPPQHHTMAPGQSVWFDVAVTSPKSGAFTEASFEDTTKARFYPLMTATSDGSYASCVSDFRSCTPLNKTKTTTITLHAHE